MGHLGKATVKLVAKEGELARTHAERKRKSRRARSPKKREACTKEHLKSLAPAKVEKKELDRSEMQPKSKCDCVEKIFIKVQ